MKMNFYDDPAFFEAYARMPRSELGLSAAGEWNKLEKLFPDVAGKVVLDLGCGYGWHCKYAVEHGAIRVTGIDQSRRMIDEALRRNADDRITYRVCDLRDYEYPECEYDLVITAIRHCCALTGHVNGTENCSAR
jgi:cyclopropane fatty-acyl-phospholipid synthase-like methyltransferase